MVKKDTPIGKIIHFYPDICVGVVSLTKGSLNVGDKIKIVRGEESFEQVIKSMQLEHKQIKEAKKGQEFGLKLDREVKPKAFVFKV